MKTTSLTRRQFFATSGAISFATLLHERICAAQGGALERIQRTQSPINLEAPLGVLDRAITPNELHYVRNHFAVPTLQANTYRLRVVGAVERELELSLDDLRRMNSRSVTMTLECAGNSRSALNPAVR